MTTHSPILAIVVALLAVGSGCSKKGAEAQTEEPAELAAGSASSESSSGDPPASASADPDRAQAEPPGGHGTPNGYVKMNVGGVTPTSAGEAVLLVDTLSNTAIPIFIGGTEALSIQLRLEKRAFVRPLTHDLYDATLERLGGHVESVRVDKLENNTFYGTVILKLERRADRIELDARPSDAIALAIGNRAPIHVARAVVDEAGIKLDDLRHGKDPVKNPLVPGDQRPDPISL